ncbi:hypothetical protein BC628DRAFT_1410145 [Trametes gibbosa]|nr:hypothetical protein BC628DRAFT_1410145 [Trametes gibbosa]
MALEVDPPGPSTLPTTFPVKDEEYWFEDGNVILIAGGVQFCLYKGPLVRHSSLFANMFSIPQTPAPPSHLGSAQGVPTFHLDMTPNDVRQFVRCLTLGNDMRIGPVHPSFDEVSACMRLGHKYQCDQMVQRSIDYLKEYYPDDIDVWIDDAPSDPPRFEPIHRIGVVNLARTTGAKTLLPVALARCCLLDGKIVGGFVREDGTRETLSQEDLARVFAGKAKLVHANVYATHRVFRQATAPDCRHIKTCGLVLGRLLTELEQDESVMDPLRLTYTWGTYITRVLKVNKGDGERGLCAKCYLMLVQERVKEEQRALFRGFPAMMGVTMEGWATKLNTAAAAPIA